MLLSAAAFFVYAAAVAAKGSGCWLLLLLAAAAAAIYSRLVDYWYKFKVIRVKFMPSDLLAAATLPRMEQHNFRNRDTL